MASEIYHVPTLADQFPVETRYWETHYQELAERYPDKLLIINGQEVTKVFDNAEDLANTEVHGDEATAGLICLTNSKPVVIPYIQVVESA